jgi:hypothetical protein
MRNNAFALMIPAALLLSACTTVEPVIKDNGPRTAPCIEGGPDQVAQQFYDLRIEQPTQGLPDSNTLAKYRPYLSDALYHSLQQCRRTVAQWRSLLQPVTGSDRRQRR